MLAFKRGWLKARHLGVFVFLGLAVSCFLTRSHPTRAFFVLESRAWELGAGAWLAVAVSRGTLLRALSHRAAAPGAVVLLFGSVIFLASGGWTPAPMAGFAVLGAVLFIACRSGGEGSPWYGAFASPPLRFVGRISYSLYLVHWPLIVFARSWFGELTPALVALVVAASLLLAIALHYAVEQPLRQKRNQVVFLSGIAGLTAVLLWCAVYGIENKGKVNPSMNAALRSIVPEPRKLREANQERKSPYRIGRTDAEPSMGLWGDSHAMAMVSALADELKQRGVCCEVWIQPGNLPGMGVSIK